ncbi:MAG TPA: PKD domain-containing protein [Candidatus Dormibacteraeota bacterium]|nr:PKD domain-containing protein [Candidatus Dormibacteraeota bacterium]
MAAEAEGRNLRRGRRARKSRGQSLVEFALITPVFMLLLLGAVDFGRMFFSYIQIRSAAGQGAMYAAVNPTDSAGITSKVQQETNAQKQRGENTLTVGTTCNDVSGTAMSCANASGGAGAGNTVTVTVTEPFNFFTPLINGLFSNSFKIQSSASAAVLGFVAGSGGSGQSGCTPPTAANFTYTMSGTFGINLDASLGALPNSGQWAISSYTWDMGDGVNPFPPVTGKTASYTYGAVGTYTITLTVQNQCGTLASTQTVPIGVAPTPSPVPTPTPAPTPGPTPTQAPACNTNPSITAGESGHSGSFSFQGAYTGQPAPVSWAWDFGDGTTANIQNPNHTYGGGKGAKYTVTLTVTNGTCVRQVTQQVTV